MKLPMTLMLFMGLAVEVYSQLGAVIEYDVALRTEGRMKIKKSGCAYKSRAKRLEEADLDLSAATQECFSICTADEKAEIFYLKQKKNDKFVCYCAFCEEYPKPKKKAKGVYWGFVRCGAKDVYGDKQSVCEQSNDTPSLRYERFDEKYNGAFYWRCLIEGGLPAVVENMEQNNAVTAACADGENKKKCCLGVSYDFDEKRFEITDDSTPITWTNFDEEPDLSYEFRMELSPSNGKWYQIGFYDCTTIVCQFKK